MRANDWVYAFRGLRRNPRFTLAAALTLALGIGANTAIFSFIDTIYLRPLPYPDAKRLVVLAEKDAKGRVRGASAASYLDWRHDPAFTAVGAWNLDVATLSGGPWPERVQALRIGGDYLSALGVTPAMGRGFTAGDERPNADCAVMVSDRLWRKWFGATAPLDDRPIKLDGAPCAVVGMIPDTFLPPLSSGMRVDAWLPLRLDPARIVDPKDRSVQVVAHLAPGVTVEAVRGRIDGAASLQERVTGTPNRALLTLAAAVGFLLLIACLNVATLVRARAAAERRQIAIRAALGASRGQLIAHQLTGTLLLAFLGGLGGLLAAYASLDGLVAMAQGTLPRLDEVHLDWRVLAFTAALSLASGLAFGLGPALGISRANLRETIAVHARRPIFRNAQVAFQIAIAFVLLAGAGLLLRSFHAIRAVDLGFRTEHVLSANFALPPSRYATPRDYVQYLDSVLAQVRSVPGVLSATVTLGVPMRGSAGGKFEVFGRPADREAPSAEIRPADPAYFPTLGLTLDRGRALTSRDVEGAPPVALVNQKIARLYFPGEDPIGKRLRLLDKNGARPWMTIVGVVRDTRHVGPLRGSLDEIYVPWAQYGSLTWQPRSLIVRAAADPERLVPALQRAVASVDKDQPLVAIGTLDASLAEFLAPQRFDTTLMAIFAALGLTLAAVGVFGVMAYGVARRTREIGVRIALGADRRRVLAMVLADGLRTAAIGLIVGWAGAWALTRYLSSLLFGVTAGDPGTLAAASAVALSAAAIASYLPARRAACVEAAIALRQD